MGIITYHWKNNENSNHVIEGEKKELFPIVYDLTKKNLVKMLIALDSSP